MLWSGFSGQPASVCECVLGAAALGDVLPASLQLYGPSLTLLVSCWWWGWKQRERGGAAGRSRSSRIFNYIIRCKHKHRERFVQVWAVFSFSFFIYFFVLVYLKLCVFCRSKHTCVLWRSASMVSWQLHSVAWCRGSTSRVRSGPRVAFWLHR